MQSVTGFGFGLVAAPAITAAAGPIAAVGGVTIASMVVNLTTLAGERRRPQPEPQTTRTLAAWSLPGMVLGLGLLRTASRDVLEAIVACTVLLAAALRVIPAGRLPHLPARPAGVLSGAFGMTTAMSGPPLLVHLLGTDTPAARTRDTLAAIFFVQGGLALVILTLGGRFELPGGMGWLVLASLVGQIAGRAVFRRLSQAAFEALAVGTLALSAALALALLVA